MVNNEQSNDKNKQPNDEPDFKDYPNKLQKSFALPKAQKRSIDLVQNLSPLAKSSQMAEYFTYIKQGSQLGRERRDLQSQPSSNGTYNETGNAFSKYTKQTTGAGIEGR